MLLEHAGKVERIDKANLLSNLFDALTGVLQEKASLLDALSHEITHGRGLKMLAE